MKKFALGVEYDGTLYHGWQRQEKVFTIQEELEYACSKIANHKITLVCAGRTDTGVHSIGQVVHFKTNAIRKNFSWIQGVNTYLSKNIVVKWIKEVPEYFHARHSAISRSYTYIIYNYNFRTALFHSSVHYIYKKLNVENMHAASQILLGFHDFSSFRGSNCQSLSPWKNILQIKVTQKSHIICFHVKANSFLYHMVRNIVGSLIEIGISKKPVSWMQEILEKKNRKCAGPTVTPKGLYLSYVEYPSCFNLPQTSSILLF